MSVDEKGIVINIGKIHRSHPRFLALEVAAQLPGPGRFHDGLGVPFLHGVVFRAAHESPHHRARAFVGPIRKDENIIAIGLHRLPSFWSDDDGSINAPLFLKSGMGVIPIRSGMGELETELSGGSRFDGWSGKIGHAIHAIGNEQAVPMQ